MSLKRNATGPARRRRWWARPGPMVTIGIGLLALVVVAGTALTGRARAVDPSSVIVEVQSLDGSGNNQENPEFGQAGNNYSRVAALRYADGLSEPVAGPNARFVSNRVFNDVNQNLFSERGISQWVYVWGQFIDHTIGLRLGRDAGDDDDDDEVLNIPFDNEDPLEEFTNTLGFIPFERSVPAPGTGVDSPREQVNLLSSYIDAFAVYGPDSERLEFLRDGPVDGDLSNNSAFMLLEDGDLPSAESRGDPAAAPEMEIDGFLRAQPERARIAGDIRANENIALQATTNLFALEHNRIVARLPHTLTEERKFQVARRVVIAEQQRITYEEFLPAFGVELAPFEGYDPDVNTDLTNEFATVGYRAHSMVHGELELETEVDRYTPERLAAFEALGLEVEVSDDGEEVELAVPLNLAFFNPDLVPQLGLGPLLQGIGLEAQYNNEEQIDNQLRSVLFQIPDPDNPECLDGPELPDCFDGVVDLSAVDIERGRDHGMPSYNELREAYGLPPVTSFTEITGEDSEEFPADPELTAGDEINDPDSLDFLELTDVDGNPIELGSEEAETDPVAGVRRTTAAARLKAVYGSVDDLDAFVGMIAERHVAGSDAGELQLAIWKREFERLRDGDRFFYLNDPGLSVIEQRFGIDADLTLAEVIALNTDIDLEDLEANVFFAPQDEAGEGAEAGEEDAAAEEGAEAEEAGAGGGEGGAGSAG